MKKIEGYIRPALVQIQWCLGMLTLVNTMFLVLGTPSWVKEMYAIYCVLIVIYLFYYFKRGRRQELTNAVQDNPIYDEVKEIRRILEQGSSNNT